ncbi:MAG: dihydrofolate reductase [bacterium]|nr:dihydrofolate reductase [bacterium]
MRKLTLIAAVAKNDVIGNAGKIPWHIPEDMALFKQITMGSTVILGNTTFKSIGQELPGRENIVLSHTSLYNSLEKALEKTRGKHVFVIGGASVYAQMMPFVDEMLISHLKEAFIGDRYFPPINKNIWQIAEEQEFQDFIHIKYTRI